MSFGSRITKHHVTKIDTALDDQAPARFRHTLVIDVRLDVENLEHALPRRHAALKDVRHPPKSNHRPAQHHQVGVERDELAESDPAADNGAAALPQNEQRAEPEEQRHAREEEALQRDQSAIAAQILDVRAMEALELMLLLSVGADDADAGQ